MKDEGGRVKTGRHGDTEMGRHGDAKMEDAERRTGAKFSSPDPCHRVSVSPRLRFAFMKGD